MAAHTSWNPPREADPMESTLLRWVVHGFQQLLLDVVGVRQANWLIPPNRTGDPGRYVGRTWKLVDSPRGVPGFLRRRVVGIVCRR